MAHELRQIGERAPILVRLWRRTIYRDRTVHPDAERIGNRGQVHVAAHHVVRTAAVVWLLFHLVVVATTALKGKYPTALIGLFISPVGFSSDVIPDKWRLLYSLNPMVGVIDGFRWAICRGTAQLYLPGFVLSLVVTAFFLWLGIWYFRRTEKTFADVI